MKPRESTKTSSKSLVTAELACYYCKGSHTIYNCPASGKLVQRTCVKTASNPDTKSGGLWGLLSMAQINAYNPDINKTGTLKALLDSGSQSKFITQESVERLELNLTR